MFGIAADSSNEAQLPLDYSRQIRPILSSNCFKCHGPDEKERQGKLRLDLQKASLQPAASGVVAIVPGRPDKSELMARISASDPSLQMPPSNTNKKLSSNEIELLRQWIQQGAGYKIHWSYVKPQRPFVPIVQDRLWVRTAIDHFILHRLEIEGLKPSAEAGRMTLIRRICLDLTGLPPTLDEIDQFHGDDRPDAYERVVDRVLASPHLGERLAQDWLDLSRYGDTNGYENDSDRSIWKYRDWVISAFNTNMPFDQFTIEQIAGDLIPNATSEQRTATGFSRNVTYNEEGGADPDEYMVKYAVDRTNTTAAVFLGMTMGCAECHDHKYDPLSQRDFYSLFAFFNSVDGEKGAQGHDILLPPLLSFPTSEQTETLARVHRQLGELDTEIEQRSLLVKEEYSANAGADVGAAVPYEYVWVDDALPVGAKPQGSEDDKPWQWGGQPANPVFCRKLSHTRTTTGFGQHSFSGATNGLRIGADDKLFAYVFLDLKNPPKTVMLQFNDGTWEHRVYWGENQLPDGENGTASRLPLGPLPAAGEWVRLDVDAKAIGLLPGAVVNGISFAQVDGRVYWDKAGLVTRTPQSPLPQDHLATWEQFELGTPNPPSKLPQSIRESLQITPEKRSNAQMTDLRNYFVRYIYDKVRETFDPLNKQHEDLKALETKTNAAIPTTMVMSEMEKRREAFILMRGNYLTPGEKVTPNVPAILPPLPTGQPANRLGLAQWLVDRDNPLTARVTVNRFWKQFFGTGLVKTMEDFGSQGEFPSHGELLDWMATEFIGPSDSTNPTIPDLLQGSKNWDTKSLLRQIVTSATYRQGSTPDIRSLELDPYNRLLSHGARFRLSAESIRDNALAICGLLNTELGGKSVYPHQPADFYADKGRWKWPMSTGRDLYRRGLYTFWRRTTFYPAFQAFDAPTRETCTVDRPRTNTPLQALVTLNDPVFVEASRVLAQRIMLEGGDEVPQRLNFAFRLCAARSPRAEELDVLQRLYSKQMAKYLADSAAAVSLVSNGSSHRPESLPVAEFAAWTAVGNVLLNLDETITRE
jgi:hypothetical protein